MHTATAEVTINAPAAEVWRALTDPELVKQYFFGTNVVSDWKQGSPIFYRGEWEGQAYEDKGTILEIVPNKLLKTNYFSPLSGEKDIPDNYQVISYELAEDGDKTVLIITQDNLKDQSAADRSAKNWNMVLGGMKTLLES
jgi:uncharacterized protein YndB with AHSA1/START domain